MMIFAAVVLASSVLPHLALSLKYRPSQNWTPVDFFDNFIFQTLPDPTHGFVSYVDRGVAQSQGLIQSRNDHVVIGVDNSTLLHSNGPGRSSVRLESQERFNHGLFVMDVSHIPTGCGTWPALWLVGESWPNDGEIDIVEGINLDTHNIISLHTSAGCSVPGTVEESGNMTSTNCDAASTSNSGCSVRDQQDGTFGSSLARRKDGGVFVLEWHTDWIRSWEFPRNGVPASLNGTRPDPTTFGTPVANFARTPGCELDKHFRNHKVVIDTTLCGDWAGKNYQDSGCPMTPSLDSMASCIKRVAEQPETMDQAYWNISWIKVFVAQE